MGFCSWKNMNERNLLYHDTEWGIPVHEDRKMFEHLMMECLQCGLSWDLILKKRQILRECFSDFDFDKISEYSETDIKHIMETEGMIRSERKIRAVIHNARCYQKIREEYGSFCNYIWAYTEKKTIVYKAHIKGDVPASNVLSEKISKDLKKRGFKYVGPITVYSHMQACGIINDHSEDCPCFDAINLKYPMKFVES